MSLPQRFPTYEQVRRLAAIYDISISTCEIADAKQQLGYRVRIAHNRKNRRVRSKRIRNWKLMEIRRILLGLHRNP